MGSLSKVLIGVIASILIGWIVHSYSLKNDIAAEKEKYDELIEEVVIEKKELIDSVQNLSIVEINSLKSNVSNLSRYSENLIKQVRNYEKNPDYDIDYITALDILSRSNYQERKNDFVKGKDN
jgi:hypothetical protein